MDLSLEFHTFETVTDWELVAVCPSVESTDTVNVDVDGVVGVPDSTRFDPEIDSDNPAGKEPDAIPVPPVSEYGVEPPVIAIDCE